MKAASVTILHSDRRRTTRTAPDVPVGPSGQPIPARLRWTEPAPFMRGFAPPPTKGGTPGRPAFAGTGPCREEHLQPDRPAGESTDRFRHIDPLRGSIMFCRNRRYLAHLPALDDVAAGLRALDRAARPHRVGDKTVKGINFCSPDDSASLQAL